MKIKSQGSPQDDPCTAGTIVRQGAAIEDRPETSKEQT
jgi:hypothetical protein